MSIMGSLRPVLIE